MAETRFDVKSEIIFRKKTKEIPDLFQMSFKVCRFKINNYSKFLFYTICIISFLEGNSSAFTNMSQCIIIVNKFYTYNNFQQD